MAKQRGSAIEGTKEPVELTVTRDDARTRIEDRIQRGRELLSTPIRTHESLQVTRLEYSKWHAFNAELLRRLFTTSEMADEYNYVPPISLMSLGETSLGEDIAELSREIGEHIHRLDSISERLELIPLSGRQIADQSQTRDRSARSNRVFIVHGHDELAKTSLEVLLKELGLEPVVLHRQADEGLTVIEKFEKHSDVEYAFVILTPDEVSYLIGDEAKSDLARKKEKRARPNVIFEFGYFVGKLGRSRVCCLHTGDVTLPSDVNGIIYKQYKHSIEEVALGIIKDLKAGGYQVTLS